MLRCLSHGSGFGVHYGFVLLWVCVFVSDETSPQCKIKTVIRKPETSGVTSGATWTTGLHHDYMSNNLAWRWEAIESHEAVRDSLQSSHWTGRGLEIQSNDSCYYGLDLHRPKAFPFFPVSSIIPLSSPLCWKGVKTGGREMTSGRGRWAWETTWCNSDPNLSLFLLYILTLFPILFFHSLGSLPPPHLSKKCKGCH